MIFRTIFSTILFSFTIIWIGTVLAERDRCEQMNAAAAPVRWVMYGLRSADQNLELLGDKLTWLSWSVRADEYAQYALIKLFYGNKLSCNSTQSNKPRKKTNKLLQEQNNDSTVRGINPFH